jgi:hypothetical protein
VAKRFVVADAAAVAAVADNGCAAYHQIIIREVRRQYLLDPIRRVLRKASRARNSQFSRHGASAQGDK